MKSGIVSVAAISAAAWLFAPLPVVRAETASKPSADRCAALRDTAISRGQIGLPTNGAVITEAHVTGDTAGPAGLCLVQGKIAPINPGSPPIHFQLNLPASWNHKAVQLGGGGFNGFLVTGRDPNFIPPAQEPVRLGYVTFGSDSGHLGGGGSPRVATGDAAFAMDAEARENFAYAQIKKTHDTALTIVAAYYGAAPRRTYFYGNSQGGHEALLAAQRFPQDYDGVVAIHPAYNFVALQLGGLAISKSIYRDPAGWLDAKVLSALGTAVVNTCDKLDGLKDGVIANLAQCRRAFRVEALACRAQEAAHSSRTCLTASQIRAIKEIDAPADLGLTISSSDKFGGWPIIEGAFSYRTPFGFGAQAVPASPPGRDDSFTFLMADQGIRYLMMQDPALNTLTFTPAQHVDSLQRASALIDVTDANFDRFHARGGKMLLMHGSVDMAIPPANSVALYQRLQQRYGKSLDLFAQFYIAYGFGHGEGAFQAEWDSLNELDRWVESGKAPGPQQIRDRAGDRAGRTMPLCRYPLWPRHTGKGDANSASSFRCVAR
ncbi:MULTISPECIES: tannase/feruloyl esterase family alpha/beta hydrolase [unclassified Novosphingobium]|uniref:tannase/feruloyl esterase family alpha/beta hydrolase n=1 Tax=unclassified Novosphingobium TaxID=2644732 RepID=UPI0025D9EB3D|nr:MULTISPECIES: tannase/feruloyl esterase family alpha/beta hydrolase [unclassified Novosphingobium]HQS68045.1 tannase/feruloyl esterase family alpha/beta hydrolase [Novosphingobium sp.]